MATFNYQDRDDGQIKQLTINAEDLPALSERILYVAQAVTPTGTYPDLLAITDAYGRFRDDQGVARAVNGRIARAVSNTIITQVRDYRQGVSDSFRENVVLTVYDDQGNPTFTGYADKRKLNFFQSNVIEGDQVVVSYWGDFLFRTTLESFEAAGLDVGKDGTLFDRPLKILKRAVQLAANEQLDDLPPNLTGPEEWILRKLAGYDGSVPVERWVLE